MDYGIQLGRRFARLRVGDLALVRPGRSCCPPARTFVSRTCSPTGSKKDDRFELFAPTQHGRGLFSIRWSRGALAAAQPLRREGAPAPLIAFDGINATS